MGIEVLESHELEHIKSHKYNTTGYSWLDNKMNPFWIKCASLIPHAISPNMVTMIGLVILSMGILIILPFDSTMTQTLPWWAYVLFALFIFGGQTFDAIDGKHARNTNRSSPLGQLMDHGCDAFSNSFIIIMICQAHLLGGSFHLILVQAIVQFTFFVIQWEEHHTGYLLTHVNNIGVTEFQFLAMGISLLPVAFGNQISKNALPYLNITIAEFLTYVNSAFGIKTGVDRILVTLKNRKFCSTFYPLFSFFCLLIAELLCYKLQSFKLHTIYIVLLNGLYFGFMTSKLIVCTMAKKPFEVFSNDNLVYLVAIIISILTGSYFIEIMLLSICAILILYKYAKFMLGITFRLMDYLKINF